MKRDVMMDRRVTRLLRTVETHCRRLDLMSGDFGKALNRVKVRCYAADLEGLQLQSAPDAGADVELIAMFFDAFKRARAAANSDDCCRYIEDVGTADRTDEHVAEMRRAVRALEEMSA